MSMLSVRDVAERARTSDRTVRRWIAEGKLTATRADTGWAVDETDLVMLDGRPSPDNGHSESVRPPNGHVDGRGPGRPSAAIQAPLLAQLLADTQAELVRTAAAAAMWQTRAEMLSSQLEQLQRALPDPSKSAPEAAADSVVAARAQNTSDARPGRHWWHFWAARPT